MLSRLSRQYRRFLLGCGFLILICYIATKFGYSEPLEIDAPPIIAAISLILAIFLFMGLLITTLALFLPAWLPLVELLGLTVLLARLWTHSGV